MQTKQRSKYQKIIIGIVSILGILFMGSWLVLQTKMHQPSIQAQRVSESAKEEKHYTFYSGRNKESIGLIFYPGGLVDPASYSLWARQVAQAGYDVYVVHFPLNLAVLAPNRAEEIQAAHPKKRFVLAGHSLGGVMASRYLVSNADAIEGMVFLASYPDQKGALNTLEVPVLSITGTNDGVLNAEAYESAKQYLPSDTRYEVIKGGNHAGFGSYGKQKGDHQATISNDEQQAAIRQQLIQWLEQFD